MKTKYPSQVIQQITEFLFIEEPSQNLPHADLVIVFGSEFITGAVDAIQQLMNMQIITHKSKVILSGATGSLNAGKESEAKRMYAEALQRGMQKDLFIVEDKATNAYENLTFSKDMIRLMGGFEQYQHILFVGKSFMLRRTQMAAAKLGFPMDKVHYHGLVDVDGKNIDKGSWWCSQDATTRVMQEIERIAKYTLKGDLTIF